ncbi:hypothetical protein IWQ60_006682 [Tieghemiomyces parasiticus]|uniref:XPG N-terminal domain-containing protein n=1 Tax=Tieghemiomyces parasiticus TaxID=78921 RepID=A0A9W8A315_9FUNG|nr:hypothetical protein IWQ60_006682 [Tieghemiomyces parasiticus]
MGVKGLTPFLRLVAPNALTERTLASYRGQTLAVDSTLLLMKFLRSELVVPKHLDLDDRHDLPDTSPETFQRMSKYRHIYGFFQFGRLLQRHEITPLFLFDGSKRPKEKAQETLKRAEQNQIMRDALIASHLEERRLQLLQRVIQLLGDLTPELRATAIAAIPDQTSTPSGLGMLAYLQQVEPLVRLEMDPAVLGHILGVLRSTTGGGLAIGKPSKKPRGRIGMIRAQTEELERDLFRLVVDQDVSDPNEARLLEAELLLSSADLHPVPEPDPKAAVTPKKEVGSTPDKSKEVKESPAKAEQRARAKVAQERGLRALRGLQRVHQRILTTRTTRITEQIYREVAQTIRKMGLFHYRVKHAESEAVCAGLYQAGITQGTISEDTDVLVLGDGPLLRNFGTTSPAVLHMDPKVIKAALGFNHEQFVDFCILCGTDFSSTIAKIGPNRARSLITTHKSIEEILRVVQCKPNAGFDYQGARRLLSQPAQVPEDICQKTQFTTKEDPKLPTWLTSYGIPYVTQEVESELPFQFANEEMF